MLPYRRACSLAALAAWLGGCVLEDPYSLESANALRAEPSTSGPEEPRPTAPPPPDPVGPTPSVEPPPAPPNVPPPPGAGGQPSVSPAETGGSAGIPSGPAVIPSPKPSVSADGGVTVDAAAVAEDAESSVGCGDGVRQALEACDGMDLDERTCESLDPAMFVGGELGCDDECEFDTAACELAPMTQCGNGVAEEGEACDGDDLGAESCTDAAYTGGKLSCDGNCELDYSECTSGAACDVQVGARIGVVHRDDLEGKLSRHNTYSCSAGGRGGDAKLAWTAPASGCFQVIVTSDRDLDTIAAVYPTCNSFSELACDDNSGTDQYPVVEFDALVGTTYALVIDAYFASDEGPITVRVAPCAPAEWTCAKEYYGRGNGCDCGCGVIDYDCSASAASACEVCNDPGSCAATTGCSAINEAENWHCQP